MGWIDRLFGKKPPPPPEIVSNDETLPFVVLRTRDNEVTLMDRDTFDYRYGKRHGSDPVQSELDEVLRRTTRIRVLSSGVYRGQPQAKEVLAECSGPAVVAALQASLRISTDATTFGHCACFGGPTIELLENENTIAVLGLQHGKALRWRQWQHDAQLLDGHSLNRWLKEQGVDDELLEDIYHNSYRVDGVYREGAPALSAMEQRVRRIDNLRLNGHVEEAHAACCRLLEAQPDLAMAYGVRALCHQDLGQIDRCVADCTAAISRGLLSPNVQFARAVCLDELGRREEAIADCTTLLALDPKHAPAYNSRGLMRGLEGQYAEGVGDLSEAIRLEPKWGLPYLNRGQLHQLAGDVDAAIEDFEQLTAQASAGEKFQGMSMQALGHFKLGECYARRGDRARASSHQQAALRLQPDLLSRMGMGPR